ncbi:uncharacterized protein VNE69_07305 [Vairimorpha necatrix]|uniref:Uncharacterized protein n=1 Tax=Vairimorpha necatrix TaxID=6039 RepID=A0AAX4JE27_9MICR
MRFLLIFLPSYFCLYTDQIQTNENIAYSTALPANFKRKNFSIVSKTFINFIKQQPDIQYSFKKLKCTDKKIKELLKFRNFKNWLDKFLHREIENLDNVSSEQRFVASIAMSSFKILYLISCFDSTEFTREGINKLKKLFNISYKLQIDGNVVNLFKPRIYDKLMEILESNENFIIR